MELYKCKTKNFLKRINYNDTVKKKKKTGSVILLLARKKFQIYWQISIFIIVFPYHCVYVPIKFYVKKKICIFYISDLCICPKSSCRASFFHPIKFCSFVSLWLSVPLPCMPWQHMMPPLSYLLTLNQQ